MTPQPTLEPPLQQPTLHYQIVASLPADSRVIFHNVSWADYEGLLEQVGEPAGLRISYDNGTLEAMTLSAEHEKYVAFINRLVSQLSFRLQTNILFFGGPTIKSSSVLKGNEPDACFYVQTASAIGHRLALDFAVDPPPDIAVEVDIHHGSQNKFPIYAALGVPEVWLFDDEKLTIHLLQQDQYSVAAASLALPVLAADVLTEFLTRLRSEGEFQTILAFDEWLRTQQP